MSVLDNYNLTFINRTHTYYNGQQDNVKQAIHNVPNDYLGYFLEFFRYGSIDDIIAHINTVQSEGFYDPEYDFDIFLRDDLYVKFTDTSLKFYDKFGGNFIQEIPFNDMIEILQLWKTFNQTPPLNNQIL